LVFTTNSFEIFQNQIILFACLNGYNAGTPFFSRFTFKANKSNQDEADLDLDLDLDLD
jgi:hypothetical protein